MSVFTFYSVGFVDDSDTLTIVGHGPLAVKLCSNHIKRLQVYSDINGGVQISAISLILEPCRLFSVILPTLCDGTVPLLNANAIYELHFNPGAAMPLTELSLVTHSYCYYLALCGLLHLLLSR